MANNGGSVSPSIARVRRMVGEVRMGLLDIEIELARLEEELRAERIHRMQGELDKIDLTGPNANASDRAAEEYRAADPCDPEGYDGDGDDCQ